MKTLFAILLIFTFFPLNAKTNSDDQIAKKISQGCPEWMAKSIDKSLKNFASKPISKSHLDNQFNHWSNAWYLVKFRIENNTVFTEHLFEHDVDNRVLTYRNALTRLCHLLPMPDVTFFLCIHDGLYPLIDDVFNGNFPIFAMSQMKGMNGILVPDYMALGERFQVFENQDITTLDIDWNIKKSILIWRGSTDQHNLDYTTNFIHTGNIDQFSRIKLCALSIHYPDMINAKFTLYAQGAENLDELQIFRGDWLSYEDQSLYKYHIIIDGNVSSYCNSGWRFFLNSVVFRPESSWTQWYFDELKPYIHYIPVKHNLDDLVEKIIWAQNNDQASKNIANNALFFAREHLTISDHMTYLYYLLQKYSLLNFCD